MFPVTLNEIAEQDVIIIFSLSVKGISRGDWSYDGVTGATTGTLTIAKGWKEATLLLLVEKDDTLGYNGVFGQVTVSLTKVTGASGFSRGKAEGGVRP